MGQESKRRGIGQVLRASIFVSRDFSILIFAEVVVGLGFGLLVPIVPKFIEILHIGEAEMGILYAMFAVAFVLAMPLSGYLADRIGRKKMLIGGTLLFGITTLALAFIDASWQFAVLRTLEGVGAAMAAPAGFALTIDLVPAEKRATALAAVGTAETIGVFAGPAIGGFVAGQINFYYPMYVGAALSFACAYILSLIREPPIGKITEKSSLLTMFGAWRRNMEQNRKLIALTTRGLVMGIVQGLWNLGLIWFWYYKVGMDPTEVGVAISIGTVVMALGTIPFGALSDKHGRIPFILMGGSLMVSGLALMALVTSVWQVFLLVAIQEFGAAMSNPSVGALLADVMLKEERGRVMGAYQTVVGIGNIIGYTVLGVVYQEVSPEAPIYLCAIALAFATAIVAVFVRERTQVPTESSEPSTPPG